MRKEAARRKRKKWFKARVKRQIRAQRKTRFNEAFRAHFVKKGILKE